MLGSLFKYSVGSLPR